MTLTKTARTSLTTILEVSTTFSTGEPAVITPDGSRIPLLRQEDGSLRSEAATEAFTVAHVDLGGGPWKTVLPPIEVEAGDHFGVPADLVPPPYVAPIPVEIPTRAQVVPREPSALGDDDPDNDPCPDSGPPSRMPIGFGEHEGSLEIDIWEPNALDEPHCTIFLSHFGERAHLTPDEALAMGERMAAWAHANGAGLGALASASDEEPAPDSSGTVYEYDAPIKE